VRRTLLSRRWLGLLVVFLVLAGACVRLGFWQLHRFQDHRAANAQVTHNVAAAPVPVQRLVTVGGTVDPDTQWRRVTASGEYDVSRQLLVRQRPLDGANGYLVLTPLVTRSGTALVVNRGWVPAGASATAAPTVPPPPSGQVSVTARLRASETAPLHRPGLPAGQVMSIAVPAIAAELPYPVYGGYAELVEQKPAPAQSLAQLPIDQRSTALNLAYAVQWWLFAVIIVVGWFFLGRREAQEEHMRTERSADSEDSAPTHVGG
jgi:cytochrome oxidase assembly protein ShyY1